MTRSAALSGAHHEDRALAYLQAQKLQLLARNARARSGEVDLILLDGETLVFVEVRQRSSSRFGGAAASVDLRKQRRIQRAAQGWLLANPRHRHRPVRFDVIAFDGAAAEPQWLQAAFGGP